MSDNQLSEENDWEYMAKNWVEIEDDYEIIQTEVEEVLEKYEEGFPPGISVDKE